jgi:hypothetical protein
MFWDAATTCGHRGEARLIQLTNEALGAVADELKRYDEDLWTARLASTVSGRFGSA